MTKQSTSGRKPKWNAPTEAITRRVPTEKITEIDNAINKICEDLKTKRYERNRIRPNRKPRRV